MKQTEDFTLVLLLINNTETKNVGVLRVGYSLFSLECLML